MTAKTILLAEDDEFIREMLSHCLTVWGYNVISASDGAKAVLLARKERPDMILMDMGLPLLNGWQATHRLKTAADTKHIPVIAVTAFAMSEDRLRCLSVGCNAFESKPINLERLQETIQELLESDQCLAALPSCGKGSALGI
jgi:two-component system, cell cycle response regulator DivK